MPADILSASLAERLRAHAGALKEIAGLTPRYAGELKRVVRKLEFVAGDLGIDAAESPREAKP